MRLSARDAQDARRLLKLLSSSDIVGEGPYAGAHSNLATHSTELISRARGIIHRRNLRAKVFGRAILGEPAWEMLLLLYVSDVRYTAARLTEASAAPRSTAMRWIDYLEGQRLVRRDPHPTDRRAAFVTLTLSGKESLEAYLSEADFSLNT